MKILLFLIILLAAVLAVGLFLIHDTWAKGYNYCYYHECEEPNPLPAPQPSPQPPTPSSIPELTTELSKNEPQSVSGGRGRTSGIHPNICKWPQHFDKDYCETGEYVKPAPDLDEIQRKLDEIKRQIIEIEIGIMLLRC